MRKEGVYQVKGATIGGLQGEAMLKLDENFEDFSGANGEQEVPKNGHVEEKINKVDSHEEIALQSSQETRIEAAKAILGVPTDGVLNPIRYSIVCFQDNPISMRERGS